MEFVKRENERILRDQEELNQILTERFQTKGRGKRADSEEISHQHKYKKIKQTKNESSSSSQVFGDQRNFHSTSDSSDDNHYTKKRKYKPYEEISGEFKKLKPPIFNGDTKKGEEAESWLSGMKKYFHIYNYSNQLKARMDIYNILGKVDIWWQDLKRVKGIREKNVNWITFKKYFKKKFLLEQYYEERSKEFYELKLGTITMKDLTTSF